MFGWDVHGKTLGILGYGRIGQAVARRAAHGFNMRVLYYTRTPVQTDAAGGRIMPATLADVLANSEFVVVVLTMTDQTKGLIGQRGFAQMKPAAILFNCARGPRDRKNVVEGQCVTSSIGHRCSEYIETYIQQKYKTQ